MSRFLDAILAWGGWFVLSPLLTATAVMIRLDSHGPVFYRAQRVGRKGGLFVLYKFRSMRVDGERSGPRITVHGDPRITRLGNVLRKFKIDELPQLFNVIRGDMAFVGPRPEDPSYVEGYTVEQRRILDAVPGITSAASILYVKEEELLNAADFDTVYRTTILPDKLAIDLSYLSNRTLRTDLSLLKQTLRAILRIRRRDTWRPA